MMAKPAASKKKTTAKNTRPAARVVVLYLVFAVLFVPVAFYTVLHLVFFGFAGGPVGIDLGIALVLPLAWAIGLLRTVKLRARPTAALAWGYTVVALLVIALIADTVRFQPILGS